MLINYIFLKISYLKYSRKRNKYTIIELGDKYLYFNVM